ncbi:MAG: FAD-dependent oxidoreductase, partial [Ruminiclostridium sp.]|nr:FAD-dependent oxidoreductase [Ruminiclostridium sp.]
ATGGVPAIPASLEGTDSPMVCTPPEIISGKICPVEESIVVVGSGMTGLETAELLSQREKDNAVLVLEAAPRLAPGVLGSNRNAITAVLEPNNVMLLVNRTLTKIGTDRIWFADSQTGEEYVYPCDRVVLALGTKPADPYGEELKTVCDKVISMGDRTHGGQIWDAIHTGYHGARNL